MYIKAGAICGHSLLRLDSLTTKSLFRIGIILLPRLCRGEASDGGCIIESV
jgi:hypothetical protein